MNTQEIIENELEQLGVNLEDVLESLRAVQSEYGIISLERALEGDGQVSIDTPFHLSCLNKITLILDKCKSN